MLKYKSFGLTQLAETLPTIPPPTAQSQHTPPPTTTKCRILELPVELLIRIFVQAQNPSLPTVCKQFWDLGSSAIVRSHYLMQIYGPTAVFSSRSMKRKIVSLPVVEHLLKSNVPFEGEDDWLFHRACELNNVDLCTWIIDAALQQQQSTTDTARVSRLLNIAAMKGSIPIIDLLVQKYHAPVETKALTLACQYNQLQTVQHLSLNYGSNVHVDNERLLRDACLHGYKDLVSFLIVGANVHAYNNAALQNACYKGHTSIVPILLKAGADAQVQENGCLKHAIRLNDIHTVKYLVKFGADPRCHHDWPLRHTCRGGLDDIVEYLLDNVEEVDLRNGILLEECIKHSRISTIQLLLDKGANPNSKGVIRGLKYAVDPKTKVRRSNTMIKMLMDKGLDINNQSDEVYQLLMPDISSSSSALAWI
jgi:ankyrin repeat protein